MNTVMYGAKHKKEKIRIVLSLIVLALGMTACGKEETNVSADATIEDETIETGERFSYRNEPETQSVISGTLVRDEATGENEAGAEYERENERENAVSEAGEYTAILSEPEASKLGFDEGYENVENEDTVVDVESEVKQIRTWYYETQDKLDSLLAGECAPNLDAYYENGYPVKMVAKKGYQDWDVSREYYYHDRNLYFVFAYGHNGEYRIYIKDGIVIRTIAPDGAVSDYGDIIPDDVREVVDRILEESKQEAFEDLFNCGA